jgi:predicted TIM-barrel fold metal-dependent hydrolase
VHLWHGEASLAEYQAQLKAAGATIAGFGGMWFGGPNQAPAGEIEKTRTNNDGVIALAAGHPGKMPIATVHPYDGQAAIAELKRVAARGIKVLKLHPHTQKFDVNDPRVLVLVRRAGERGVIVLMVHLRPYGRAELSLLEYPGAGAHRPEFFQRQCLF